jgi:uncharacterized protein YabE (DUF348 family)
MSDGSSESTRRKRSGGVWISLALTAAAVLLGVGYVYSQQRVTLSADGRSVALNTHQTSVAGLLGDVGLELMQGDQVVPRPDASLHDGMEITVVRARVVTVDIDGRLLTHRTQASSLAELLDELSISLSPADSVVADGVEVGLAAGGDLSDPPSLPQRVTVRRSVPLVVVDHGVRLPMNTLEPTVGRALQEAGITLYLGDDLQPPLHTRVTPGMEVTILRSVPVSVHVDGETIHTRTHRTTVGELLAELGLALIGQDYTLPSLEELLEPGETVRVVRVLEEIVTEHEPIPYETAWQPDPNLEIDLRRVAQQGAPGLLQRRIRVRYEDGQEVSRVLEDEWVAQAPTSHIIAYGTKIVIRQLETPDEILEYWRKLRVLATSYTAATSGKEPSHPAYGITAMGWPMRTGIVAVDPRVINLLQQVYVPGYGVGVAADTGGAIKGRRIDLGYEEEELVLWYDWVDVYLLTPHPDPTKIRYTIGD